MLIVLSCERVREYKILIHDKNETGGIQVEIVNTANNAVLIKGYTDAKGQFKASLKLTAGKQLRIRFEKDEFVISPEEILLNTERGKLVQWFEISALPMGKAITFAVRNRIGGVSIYANRPGQRRISLGKTDRDGILKSYISNRKFPQLQFSYEYDGAEVFPLEPEMGGIILFDDLPSQINLVAVPKESRVVSFDVVDKYTGIGVVDMAIAHPEYHLTSVSNPSGRAQITIHPSSNGPFIGDTLKWQFSRKRYQVFDSVSTVVDLVSPPIETHSIRVTRVYNVDFVLFEKGLPLEGISILVDGNATAPSDNKGIITYSYHSPRIGEELTISVPDNMGLVIPQIPSVKLGRDDQIIEIRLSTIHVILSIVDAKTGKAVPQPNVTLSGRSIGSLIAPGSVKITLPKLGRYSLDIGVSDDSYYKRSFTLDLDNTTTGKTLRVELDPKTSVTFVLRDKSTREAVKDVDVFHFVDVAKTEQEALGKTNQDGRFTHELVNEERAVINYVFSRHGYIPLTLEVDNPVTRVTKNVELEPLYATVFVKDAIGRDIPDIEINLDRGKGAKTDQFGMAQIYPPELKTEYVLKAIDPQNRHENQEQRIYIGRQAQQFTIVMAKQPWFEFKITDEAGFPFEGVTVTGPAGTGLSDSSGLYRQKILNRQQAAKFVFSKQGYEDETIDVIADEGEVPVILKSLIAYFVVEDARTLEPVGYLQVYLNGNLEGQTGADDGRAIILPQKKPSILTIKIVDPHGRYGSLTKEVNYTQDDLGIFKIEPTPIKINVKLRWAETPREPVVGTLEIDNPYDYYELIRSDSSEHTFEYIRVDLETNPTLIITATTPTGRSFKKEIRIQIPKGSYEVPVADNLLPRPFCIVLANPDAYISILHNVNGTQRVFVNRHQGEWSGELPDFGEFIFVRESLSRLQADSLHVYVDRSQFEVDLELPPNCQEVALLLTNSKIDEYLNKVDELVPQDKCYCSEIAEAIEITTSNPDPDYKRSATYFNKLFRDCPTDSKNPFHFLRALRAYYELKDFDKGEGAYSGFRRRIATIPEDRIKETTCRADYIYGKLMYLKYEDYNRQLRDPTLTSSQRRQGLTDERDKLRRSLREFIENYQNNPDRTCGSLQQELHRL